MRIQILMLRLKGLMNGKSSTIYSSKHVVIHRVMFLLFLPCFYAVVRLFLLRKKGEMFRRLRG